MNRMTAVATMLLTIVISGCGPGPQDLAAQLQEAINSGDLDSAVELFSDDAVLLVGGAPSRVGKAEIGDWLATQSELNFRIEGTPVASESGVAYQNCSISSDIWSYFGVNPMTGTCEVALDGGDITGFTIRFDENSMARLSDSPAASATDLIGIWITRNYLTDSGDLYLHFFDQGIGRLAASPIDSTTAPDADFEGASLMWTYEDYILTIQNDGPASENYCQEQDVGNYLVKTLDEGGLHFKPINDSCDLRKVAFRLPPRWRPHEP